MGASAAPATPDLTVVITTFNSMRTMERCLRTVLPIARSVRVVDSGSTDGTVEFCQSLGAEVTHHDWEGYSRQKQFALDLPTQSKWVLLLDSDESMEPSLQVGLAQAIAEAGDEVAGIEINRMMWFQDGWVRHVSFPDWVLRCCRVGQGHMVDRTVHERMEVGGAVVRAAGICRHDSWDGICDAIARSARYAQLSAQCRKPSAFPLVYAVGSALAMVCKQLILKRGVLDGRRGITVAGVQAIGRFATAIAASEAKR